jgi:hypothetical protein
VREFAATTSRSASSDSHVPASTEGACPVTSSACKPPPARAAAARSIASSTRQVTPPAPFDTSSRVHRLGSNTAARQARHTHAQRARTSAGSSVNMSCTSGEGSGKSAAAPSAVLARRALRRGGMSPPLGADEPRQEGGAQRSDESDDERDALSWRAAEDNTRRSTRVTFPPVHHRRA